jgi:hypothetical protein
MPLTIRIGLLSDATFGAGEGVPGSVDVDVARGEDGLPVVPRERLSALLADSGREVLRYVAQSCGERAEPVKRWQGVHDRLFGRPGRRADDQGMLRFEPARLPDALRHALLTGRTVQAAFSAVTATRRQTAIDAETGAAQHHSLRAMRVILRPLVFEAELRRRAGEFERDEADWIAICAANLRRAGTARSRGRGRLGCSVLKEDLSSVLRRFESSLGVTA